MTYIYRTTNLRLIVSFLQEQNTMVAMVCKNKKKNVKLAFYRIFHILQLAEIVPKSVTRW